MSETATVFKVLPGDHLTDTIRAMLAQANSTGQAVAVRFNGQWIIAEPGGDAAAIEAQWQADITLAGEKYRATAEYRREQEAAARREEARTKAREALLAVAPARLSLRDPDGWASWLKAQSSEYGEATFRYADLWARLMEARMKNGQTLAECALKTSHLADAEGVTGLMQSMATSILCRCWAHGEELKEWKNARTGEAAILAALTPGAAP